MKSTAHLLTTDIANTIKPFFDKRKDHGWMERPVFKAGTRMVLVRRISDVRDDIAEVSLAPDQRRDPYDPSTTGHNRLRIWWEMPTKSDVMNTVLCLPHHVDERFPLKKKEQAENDAYTHFINAMMGALSAPLIDYGSVWLHRGEASNEEMQRVMHRLFIAGQLSLSDIEAHLDAITAEDHALWEAAQAAKLKKT